ncbi:MAG: TetR/AcrR family transcriptional regulator [Phycicoccus sp.]
MTPSPPRPSGPPSRRSRYREQTLAEIKGLAVRRIRENGGAGGLSFNALAKELGMAGPSLYRYYASRDALLTELLVDAYADFAEAITTAVADTGDPADDVRRLAGAYRAWALANPELYELLLGTPVPGYSAPPEATREVAVRGFIPLVAAAARLPRGAGGSAPAPPWAEVLADRGFPDDALVTAVRLWTRLHGVLTLELHGHLGQMVDDPGALYEAEVAAFLANG